MYKSYFFAHKIAKTLEKSGFFAGGSKLTTRNGASSRTRTYDPTLAVPESCYPLGARATFDRGANPFSLHHPPGALGGVAVNSRNASAKTQNRNFRSYIKQQNKSGHPFGMSALVLGPPPKFEPHIKSQYCTCYMGDRTIV